MVVIYWSIILLLFFMGIVGSFIPIIPDILPLWLGVITFKLSPLQGELGSVFWLLLILITIFNIMADFFSNAYFVRKAGGTKLTILAAVVGLIIGMIILPPIGIILGPFIAVLAIELSNRNDFEQALKVALATFTALVGSGIIKVILQLIIIFWFIFKVV